MEYREIPFRVPALRERRDDIPLLARHFIAELSAEYGKRPKELAPEALEILVRQPWPGNVRELRNTIERLVIMTPGDRIEARQLPGFKKLSPNEMSKEKEILHKSKYVPEEQKKGHVATRVRIA